MKALIVTKYGSPDVLEMQDIEKPVPRDNEVLLKVHASSINDWDLGIIESRPYFMRLSYGLFKPKIKIVGTDVVGTVESIGKDVTSFQPGDPVYGDLHACGFGAFAEYVCAQETALLPKPRGLSFEDAAAIPHSATLAWQSLYDKATLKDGLKILINGAGGGVGPIALQIIRQFQVEVTGVDAGDKLDMLKSLGFDHVIDYQKQDFSENKGAYDLILDMKSARPPSHYARALKTDGVYVTVGGSLFRLIQILLFGRWIALTRNKHLRILALKPNRGLTEMAELLNAGKIKPVVEGPYPMSETVKALKLFSEARQKGRIVIKMENSTKG